jgi:hypothetical protein
MHMNERNTLAVCASVAITTVLVFVAAVVGNTLSSQATERENIKTKVELVQCVQSGKSVTDCRNLLYGVP